MKLSIVTPSFNSGKYIRETIESIAGQSYRNFEHIVIDGLSKDNTLEIVKEYKHIKFISEKDSGQSNAINKGFKMADGDILAWQNADDIYFPNTFKVVIDFFNKNPGIDVVYGYYQLVDSESKWICDVYPRQWSQWLFAHGRFCPPQPVVFWRRKVYESVGQLNENLHYCMDVDFYSRSINKDFTFSRIPEMLGKFRVHTQSKTQDKSNDRKVYEEYRSVLSTNFNYNAVDMLLFNGFQQRAKVTKIVKQKLLKKL
jgi:glycosyltransferase involved in cell wall biosynthesis